MEKEMVIQWILKQQAYANQISKRIASIMMPHQTFQELMGKKGSVYTFISKDRSKYISLRGWKIKVIIEDGLNVEYV